jgi:lipoate-protein ligase A
VTNGPFEEVLRKKPSVLLLPYCAKLTTCELRYEKGCNLCGDCSIGDAWTRALTERMDVVSIVSFEDLRAELEKMKAAGVPAFIGCCCEPFFTKHADDFDAAGVPGILLDIDNTTCYELDRAREAYAGRFENQTRVNLDLLDAVLSVRDGTIEV